MEMRIHFLDGIQTNRCISLLTSMCVSTFTGGCVATNSEVQPDSVFEFVLPDSVNVSPVFYPDAVPENDLVLLSKVAYKCPLIGLTGSGPCGIEPGLRARTNYLLTDYYRRYEGKYYHNKLNKHVNPYGTDKAARGWPENLPKTCLALSGGGIRSAAFSLGVLQGLSASGNDDKLDVISAVSGGSYTLGWLYGQLKTEPHPSGIRHVTHNQELVGTLTERVDKVWFNNSMLAGGAIVAMTLRPFAAATNSIVSLGSTQTPSVELGRTAYGLMIEDTFFPYKSLSRSNPFLITDLRPFIEENSGTIPIPVINAAAFPASNLVNVKPATASDKVIFKDSVFEFTPFRQGSAGYGYNDKYSRYGAEMAELVAISGAAPDVPTFKFRFALQLITGRFGLKYPVFYGAPFAVMSDVPENMQQQLDITGKDNFFNSIKASRNIELVDGSAADNLGVFPLVERLCERIIVVDATYDPNLVFDDYGRLAMAVEDELGARLAIPRIDEIAANNRAAGTLKPKPECGNENEMAKDCFGSSYLSTPVFYGNIGRFPYNQPDNDLTLQVVYVKLSLDRDNLRQYNKPVQDYVQGLKVQCGTSANGKCRFPHDTTGDQWFSGKQFDAYRELGRIIAERCIGSDLAEKPYCLAG
jgi:hypothetical protein